MLFPCTYKLADREFKTPMYEYVKVKKNANLDPTKIKHFIVPIMYSISTDMPTLSVVLYFLVLSYRHTLEKPKFTFSR